MLAYPARQPSGSCTDASPAGEQCLDVPSAGLSSTLALLTGDPSPLTLKERSFIRSLALRNQSNVGRNVDSRELNAKYAVPALLKMEFFKKLGFSARLL